MKKAAVIYWSGTGNTEAMANAVAEGMKGAGAEVSLLSADAVSAADLAGLDAVALGCPAMGSEVLEEDVFEPLAGNLRKDEGAQHRSRTTASRAACVYILPQPVINHQPAVVVPSCNRTALCLHQSFKQPAPHKS